MATGGRKWQNGLTEAKWAEKKRWKVFMKWQNGLIQEKGFKLAEVGRQR